MTDAEIKKAFAICNSCIAGSCEDCPCYNHEGVCIVAKNDFDLEQEVFNLINRQQARIKELEERCNDK
jgi:hypothetical protein